MNPYEKRIIDDLETVQIACYNDMNNLHEYPQEVSRQILRKLIEWACQPQNKAPIILARKKIGEINKDWLKLYFLDVAKECIDFEDYWEYSRLLEVIVLELLEIKVSALKICENSEDEDIQEIIADYKEDVQ